MHNIKVTPILISCVANRNYILLSYGKRKVNESVSGFSLDGFQPSAHGHCNVAFSYHTTAIAADDIHLVNGADATFVPVEFPYNGTPDAAMVIQFLSTQGRVTSFQMTMFRDILSKKRAILCGIGYVASFHPVGNEQERYGQMDVVLRVRWDGEGTYGWVDYEVRPGFSVDHRIDGDLTIDEKEEFIFS